MDIGTAYLWPHYVRAVAGEGVTQQEIADAAGVSQTTASRWLAGTVSPTIAGNVAAFAQSYKRGVIEAFVAAGLLSFKDAQGALPEADREFLAGLRTEWFPLWIQAGVIDEDGNLLRATEDEGASEDEGDFNDEEIAAHDSVGTIEEEQEASDLP